MLERLEDRLLLSATLNPKTGLLTIAGTKAADVIHVNTSNGIITVAINSTESRFPKKQVAGIYINGGKGNDAISIERDWNIPTTLFGSTGHDTLKGGAGKDLLDGGIGNDLLDGRTGADVLIGGAGFDKADYSDRTAAIYAALGAGPVSGQKGEKDDIRLDVEAVKGGKGNDRLVGSSASNLLEGGDGNDLLWDNLGNDTLIGDDGNDTLEGGAGADTYRGDDGLDTVTYNRRRRNLFLSADGLPNDGEVNEHDDIGSDIEIIIGGRGNDFIIGASGENQLYGGQGNDTLQGKGGNDLLDGGPGNDSLDGGSGNDVLLGSAGDDTLDGGSGADKLAGGDGRDTADYSSRDLPLIIKVNGRADDGQANERDNVGNDIEIILGGKGNDLITAGGAAHWLKGGDGRDTLIGTAEADTLDGEGSDDLLQGLAGDDQLLGGSGDDRLEGGDGHDKLLGGSGADVLLGDAGDDTLDGGTGSDDFQGGPGTDTADYSSRTADLTINRPDGLFNDGETNENDNVRSDIEQILEGSGDNIIF